MTASATGLDDARLCIPADEHPIVRVPGRFLTRADLHERAQALAARLPDGPAALNLCERREHYLTTLLALELRGQVCLMPPSRAPGVLQNVQSAYPGSYRIDDARVIQSVAAAVKGGATARELDPRRVAAIGYTSGSTGMPHANPKTWRSFADPGRFNAASLRRELVGHASAQPWLVATVPSQHMYGMEWTAIAPLLFQFGVHAAHPLFPADIAATLADVPAPRVLVSTPVHLRTLLESDVAVPELAAIVSATAPLPAELAARLEARYATRVLEFFGSTETCVIASRRTASDHAWTLYPGVRLVPAGDGTLVEAPWLDAPVAMSDVFDVDADGRVRVVGRSADMVEVAGKRASLADLTRLLLAVPGVSDAVVLQPVAETSGVRARRLVAFVVGATVTPQAVAAALAGQIDPVFMPRPIVCVESLPRNEVGKLPREQLLRLVREHASSTQS